MAGEQAAKEGEYRRRLLATGAAYGLGHHLGVLPPGDARWRGSSWVDWADLLLPYAVLGLAAGTLLAAGVGRRTWIGFGVAGLLYTQGHGIHLAANSIGNAQPSAAAFLWDELAGHAIWYAGAAMVVATLAATMAERAATRNPAAIAVAIAVGATWATNALGGHFLIPGTVLSGAAAGYGAAQRHTLAWLVGLAGLSALVVLGGAVLGG